MPVEPAANPPLRVMVVDDSSVVRGLLTRLLEQQPDIEVISSVSDGQMAVNSLRRQPVDVIILDIEMPRMDGLTALPMLLEAHPDVQVIVASTLTAKNAEISLQALERGAADYLTKPSSTHGGSMDTFNRQLVEKVIALGYASRGHPRPVLPAAPARKIAPSPDYKPSTRPLGRQYRPSIRPVRPRIRVVERRPGAAEQEKVAPVLPKAQPQEIVLRAAGKSRPRIIAIGSSTGGPQALIKIFGELGQEISVPVMITQHMPPTFTKILAEHIGRASGLTCKEAEDGDVLKPGQIYIAPGDYHMLLTMRKDLPTIRIEQGPPVNFCRPAVDPMFSSIARIFGPSSLAMVLTGMGQDGLAGAREIVDAGGTLIAQDESTSVVWGMPGAVATRGLCSAVLPLESIAAHLKKFMLRSAA